MVVYYITILISTFFAAAAGASNKLGLPKRKNYDVLTTVILSLSVITLIFTAGLRYYVGSDFGAYYKGLVLYGSRLNEALRKLDEPGLPILAKIVGIFTDDGAYFIFICSLITIVLLLVPTYKHTESFVFVILLFVFTGNWHGSFNGVRQFLAAAIIFAGHRLILDKKLYKYLLVVFLAFCVHKSAIIMVVLYFILRNRITAKNVIFLLIGTAVIAANYETVFSFIGFLKESDMQLGDYEYYSRSVNIYRILVFCAPALAVLLLYIKEDPDKEQSFYINLILVNAAAMLATSNSAYLARLSIYTNVFTPLALAKLLVFRNKIIDRSVKFAVIVLYGIFWYIEVTGSGALYNFRWIWER